MSTITQARADIAFAYPSYENAVYRGCTIHAGAASVRAVLAENGIRSDVVLSHKNAGIDGVVERILATGAPVVGLTCYDESYYVNSLVSRALKQRQPELKILFGGPSATFSDTLIAEHNPQVDAVVRGEVEATITDLVSALVDGDERFRAIRGVTCRHDGEIVRNPEAPLVGTRDKGAELDCLPSPYVAGFIDPTQVGEVGLQTSRGCVYRCSFCNFTIISQHRVRYFSVDRVLEDLAWLAERIDGHVDQPVPIFDDFFSLNLKRVKKILSGMIDLGLQHKMKFLCETRADAVDREFFSLLREAGCVGINFGLESAVPEVLRNARKLTHGERPDCRAEEQFLERVKQSVGWAREEDLSVSVTIILGLPGEDFEAGRRTIEFVDDLGVNTYGHNFLQVFPGTELFHTHAEHGIRIEPSATVLPYVTHPAYGLAEVPFLRNGTVPSLWLERNKWLGGVLSGMPEADDRSQALVLRMDDKLERALLDAWVQPASEVVLDYSESTETPEVWGDFTSFVEHDYPLIRATLIESSDGDRFARDVNRGTLQHANFASRIRRVPFKQLRHGDPFLAADTVNQTLYLLSLEDDGDLEAFGHELDRIERDGVWSFPLSWLNRTLLLADSCRWAAPTCTSPDPVKRRWTVCGSSVHPCRYGGAVSGVAAGPEAAGRRLVVLEGQASLERGCETCALGDSCSRCPFPFPFATDAAFCEFRRAHPSAPDFERLLWIKNAFLRSRTRLLTDEHAGGRSARIKLEVSGDRPLLFDAEAFVRWVEPPPWAEKVARSRFATQACLASFYDKVYLTLPADLTTVELSPALAEIWEALAMQVHPSDMEAHFRRRYDLDSAAYRANLEQGLEIFDELGFFAAAEVATPAAEDARRESFFLRNVLVG